jgi:GTP-binding protein Era
VHSGLAALIGRPGTGKSALLNRLVGEKLSIVTPVPLTTRGPVRGVHSGPGVQVVWIDTPPIHRPRHRLGERMVRQARAAAADADVVVVVADAGSGVSADDEPALAAARESAHPVLLAMNKSDRIHPAARPGVAEAAGRVTGTAEAVVVSASSGDGLDALARLVAAHLPEGSEFFPPGVLTDQPEPVRIAELIREQVVLLTRQEIPHAVAVEVDEITPREEGDVMYVRAVVHVDRDAQRKILIGAGGKMLKRIGQSARPAIERLLGARVYLDLWVKVTSRWYNREDLLARLYPD